MTRRLSADARRMWLGGGVIVGGVAVIALFLFGTIPRLVSGGTTDVRASFASVGALNVNEPVRVDGVTVGKVSKIQAEGNSGATVTMRVNRDAGKLYANARADIRWRTVLGGAYTVAIDRGTPGLPELHGAVIPRARTSNQVEIDEITGTLRRDERRGLKTTFHELPKVFADPRQPGEVLATLGAHGKPIAAGLQTLRGVRPDSDLRRLVKQTGGAMRALDAPRDQLGQLVANAAITTATTARRAQDISATIRLLATGQPRLRRALADADATLRLANPLLAKLRAPAAQLAPTLARLQPVVASADGLLRTRVRPLVRSLQPAAHDLAITAQQGVPLLDELAPSLARIDAKILPQLAKRSSESKHTTYEMIGPAIAGLEGAAAHYDKHGYYVRLLGNGGGHFYDGAPCGAWFTQPTSPAFLQCKSLTRVFEELFGGKPPKRGGR